jgi:hypothetical protein
MKLIWTVAAVALLAAAALAPHASTVLGVRRW